MKFSFNLHAIERFDQRVRPFFRNQSPESWMADAKRPREKEIRKFKASRKLMPHRCPYAKIFVRRLNELVFAAVVEQTSKTDGEVKTFLVWENDKGHLKRKNIYIDT